MKQLLSILAFCVFIHVGSFAQSSLKVEVEKRIDKNEFSQQALRIIPSQIFELRRLKYFLEIDGTDTSYEMKFKKNNHKYSVEFSVNGLLQDVEMMVTYHQLPSNVKESINTYLTDTFVKHKIRKTQIQYVHAKATSNELADLFNGEVALFEVSYEIEIAVKNHAGKPAMYEFHFDENGQFLNKRIFKQQNDDNILY